MAKKKQLDIPGTERIAHPEIEEAALELREVRAERMRLTKRESEAAERLKSRMQAANVTVYKLDATEDDAALIASLEPSEVLAKVRKEDPKRKSAAAPTPAATMPTPTPTPTPSEPAPAGDVLVRVQDGGANLVDCPVEKCGAKAMMQCRDERGEIVRGQVHASRLQAASEAAQKTEEGKPSGVENSERGAEFYEEIGKKGAPAEDTLPMCIQCGAEPRTIGNYCSVACRESDAAEAMAEDEPDGEPVARGATRIAPPKGRAGRSRAAAH